MHKYITYSKYAYENEEFTRSEVEDLFGLTGDEFGRYFTGTIAHHTPNPPEEGEEQKWRMSQEAFYQYLDYIELKEARESSSQAKRLAIIAIFISGTLALSSIGISIWQINTISTVKIESEIAD